MSGLPWHGGRTMPGVRCGMSQFNSDVTRRLMASYLWEWGPAGRCNQCEVAMDRSLRFRWCDHLFCVTCATGVLGSCPSCQAAPPEMADDDLAAEAEAATATRETGNGLRSLGTILILLGVLFLILLMVSR